MSPQNTSMRMKYGTKNDKKISKAFHEVYSNVPKNVIKTGKKGKAKARMMTAIALSKARKAGAKIAGIKKGRK